MNEDSDKILLADFDEWLVGEKKSIVQLKEQFPQYKDSYDQSLEMKLDRRDRLHAKFPFVACVKGFDPVLSYTTRWCWQQFGPYDGNCTDHYNEYPACPLVLATAYERPYSYKDCSGNLVEDSEIEYKDPGEHSHEGEWSPLYIDKIGYDYFIVEYCFKTEEMLRKFLDARQTFDSGEKYRL